MGPADTVGMLDKMERASNVIAAVFTGDDIGEKPIDGSELEIP
jgi:hypothetical protein